MTTIYFLRHGEYVNPEKIVPWRLPNFPLSEIGRLDILKDAEYFDDKNIEIIYSSPVLRTKQSAEIIANRLKKRIIISQLISEVYTPLQYRRITYKEFYEKRTYPFLDSFHIQNNGENYQTIYNRVNKLVKAVLKKHTNKNIIFVSHGDPIMIYLLSAEGRQIDNEILLDSSEYIPKSGIIKFTYDGESIIKIKKINY